MAVTVYSPDLLGDGAFNVVSGIPTLAVPMLTGVLVKKMGSAPVLITFTSLAIVQNANNIHRAIITDAGKCLLFRSENDGGVVGVALYIIDTVTETWESSQWFHSASGVQPNYIDIVEFNESTQVAHVVHYAGYSSMGSDVYDRKYANYNLTTDTISGDQFFLVGQFPKGRVFNSDYTMCLCYYSSGSTHYYVNLSTGVTQNNLSGFPDYATINLNDDSLWLRSGLSNQAFYAVHFTTNNMAITAGNFIDGSGNAPTWANKYSGTQNTDGSVIGRGCRLNSDETLLYVYCHVDLGSGNYQFRMWSLDITGAWSAAATPALVFDLPINTKGGTSVGLWELNGGGLYVGNGEAEDATVLLNMGLVSDPAEVYWEEFTPFIITGTDLTLALYNTGNGVLGFSVGITELSKLIAILTSSHEFEGIIIDPQDEVYFLELDNGTALNVPLIWITLRKSLNSETGYVEIETTCKVPGSFEEQLSVYVNQSARVYKQILDTQSDLMNGLLSELKRSNRDLLLTLTATQYYGGATINLAETYYTRISPTMTLVRVAPKTSINVGDTIITGTNVIKASRVSTHISLSQSFTEIS